MINKTSNFTDIEVLNPINRKHPIKCALFDFDGTLSLIREGWQEIMIPMMVRFILEESPNEDVREVSNLVEAYVTDLTGKQTIYQMIRLAEEITKRGGEAKNPLDYKKIYNRLLLGRINDRLNSLVAKTMDPKQMLVPASSFILEDLQSLNITCYLASGTDEIYVQREADLLGISNYFEKIYGAIDQYELYSKQIVIERILEYHNICGNELLVFGDGFVEIQEAKRVNGIAIGVATNEKTREGIDSWKRERLIGAGADMIIPNYNCHTELIELLFTKSTIK